MPIPEFSPELRAVYDAANLAAGPHGFMAVMIPSPFDSVPDDCMVTLNRDTLADGRTIRPKALKARADECQASLAAAGLTFRRIGDAFQVEPAAK